MDWLTTFVVEHPVVAAYLLVALGVAIYRVLYVPVPGDMPIDIAGGADFVFALLWPIFLFVLVLWWLFVRPPRKDPAGH